MRDQLDKVKRFHETSRAYIEYTPTVEVPKYITEGRINIFREELEEYRRAVDAGDIVEVADALTDMLYVIFGTFIAHGLQDVAVELFEEVHRSNMSKLDGGRSTDI